MQITCSSFTPTAHGVILSRDDEGTSVWYCYALCCADDTLYAGITTDLTRRVAQHNAGRGARYTAGRRPVRLVAAWRYPDRGAAQRAEARFRRLTRAQKLMLVARDLPFEGAPFHHSEQKVPTGLHESVADTTEITRTK
jgi:putative endonuclease